MSRAVKDETTQRPRGNRLRVALCALVLALVAIPAARVYMYDRPLVESMTIVDGDDEVNTLSGHGLANSPVQVWYRQRNFHQGDKDGTGPQFSWCGAYNSGWLYVGGTTTSSTGAWNLNIKNSRVVVYPTVTWLSGQTTAPCGAGLTTEFLAKHTTSSDPAGITTGDTGLIPTLKWFRIVGPAGGSQQGNAQAVVDNAYNSAISIADGPNGPTNPHGNTTLDVNSSAMNCEWGPGYGPCPRAIRFTAVDTPPAPSITVTQDNVFPSDTDPEFPFLLGQLNASSPGGTLFASGKRDRPNITGAATIKVVIKFPNISLGCGGGFDPSQLFGFLGL